MKIKKSNNLIIFLSSILLVLIFSIFLSEQGYRKEPGVRARNVIELRDYGFFPEEITIEKGETVTFISRREIPFWPASDDHPEHAIYPEFDAKKAVNPGEAWSFTFDKIGSWGFHDHLGAYYSTDRGVIHVVREGESAGDFPLPSYAKVRDCGEEQDTRKCWIGNLKATLLEEGMASAFNLLSDYYDKYPEFANNCNDITHYLGGFAFRVYKDNKKQIVTPEVVLCNGGFVHGFMEVWFHNYPKKEEVIGFCRYVEDKLGEEKPHAIYACYHGLGHGVYHSYLISDWSQFAFQLEPSIEVCEKTDHIDNCLDGMFNAVSMDYYLARYKYLDEKEDPLKYCEGLDEYKWECYDGLAGIYLWGGEGDLSDIYDVVSKIEDDELARASLQTLVQIYSFKKISSDDHSEIVEFCHSLRESLTQPCLRSYVTGLVEQGRPGEEYIGGFSFCEEFGLSQEERDYCYTYTTDYSLTYYSKEEKGKVCEALTGDYRDYCLEKI